MLRKNLSSFIACKEMMLVNISDQSKFVNRDVMVNMIARDVVDPGFDKIRPNQNYKTGMYYCPLSTQLYRAR